MLIELVEHREVVIDRGQILEDGLLTIVHTGSRGDVVETHGMAELVADRVAPGRITVIRTIGRIEERVVELNGGRLDMIATGVEEELRQPQPPRLGAVHPVADL